MPARRTSFGDTLRARRTQLGINRETVAFAIGRTVVTIANWECGRTRPSDDDLERLAKALQCEASDLLGGVHA